MTALNARFLILDWFARYRRRRADAAVSRWEWNVPVAARLRKWRAFGAVRHILTGLGRRCTLNP